MFVLVDVEIQVVAPSFSALLGFPEEALLRLYKELLGDNIPLIVGLTLSNFVIKNTLPAAREVRLLPCATAEHKYLSW